MSNTIKGFRARNDEIAAKLASRSEDSKAFRHNILEQMETEDRQYKMGLAAVREAGHLTQDDLARKLGRQQTHISRTERSQDMLYSTLLAYLEAAGATDVALTATVAGHKVEIALANVAAA